MPPRHDIANPAALSQRFRALGRYDTLVLAVSGGSDSVALLWLVDRWLGQAGRRAPRIVVATVDHGLRDASAEEARWVRALALSRGYEHRLLRWCGAKPKTGLQSAARAARYRLLGMCVSELGGRTALVTAHTLDDQAETVLMRLGRGSGVDGLAAIAEAVELDGICVHRPLLDVGRGALRDVLSGTGLDWLEDPSNQSTRFERVRVRRAGAARAELGLEDRALARTARRMSRARQALEHAVDAALVPVLLDNERLRRFGVFVWPPAFGVLPDEVQIRLLRRVVLALGGQGSAPELGQTEDLFARMRERGFGGATLHGCRVDVGCAGSTGGDGDGRQMLCYREIGRLPLPTQVISRGKPCLWDRRFRVRVRCPGPVGVIEVSGCGDDDLALMRREPGWRQPADVPRDALLSLPAVRDAAGLVALPALGWSRQGMAVSAAFAVERLREPPGSRF